MGVNGRGLFNYETHAEKFIFQKNTTKKNFFFMKIFFQKQKQQVLYINQIEIPLSKN